MNATETPAVPPDAHTGADTGAAGAAPAAPAPAPAAAYAAAERPGFRQLLARYLLPLGLCAEPCGDVFQAHAMHQANKAALRRWMPHYARVHTALAVALLTFCSGANAAELSGWLVAAAAVPTACEVVMAITFGCVAFVLRSERE